MNVCGLFLLTFSVFFHNYLQILLSRGTKLIGTAEKTDLPDLVSHFNFALQQVVEYDPVSWNGMSFLSTVIGKDFYTLRSFDGQERHWVSYTLQASPDIPESALWAPRWWGANVPEIGPHFYRSAIAQDPRPPESALDPRLSGAAIILSEGDATFSTPNAELFTYVMEGHIFVRETFFNLDGTRRNTMEFVGIPKIDA